MKGVLVLATVGEVSDRGGVADRPSRVGRLLLGAELTGTAVPVARVAGIALIGLGVACWPGPPRVGMSIYSAAVTLYLAYLGVAGGASGRLLWPAVVLHLILTVLLLGYQRAKRCREHRAVLARRCRAGANAPLCSDLGSGVTQPLGCQRLVSPEPEAPPCSTMGGLSVARTRGGSTWPIRRRTSRRRSGNGRRRAAGASPTSIARSRARRTRRSCRSASTRCSSIRSRRRTA